MKAKYLFLLPLIAGTLFLASCTTGLSSITSSNQSISDSISLSSQSSEQRVFTLEELAQYNGDNGSEAYIAVYGIVYDVTHADGWTNGWHRGQHLAGTDATAAFADSPHSESILNSLPIVGVIE
ncbi:hypothetical protein SDC9_126818 [bioreactor metagenome]|uniref:Cytochrome b5 heme-binding domain-containing protein n=1 Tax=bioreactor metagenome TaxID=1076179 RepID=A0A645CS80_9ZZZZ